MMRLDISRDFNFIAKNGVGSLILFKSAPTLAKDHWIGDRWWELSTRMLDLGPIWKDSVHRLIRDGEGYVVDLAHYIPDPREELKVDDVLWVWHNNREFKVPRCFHSYSKSEEGIRVFIQGMTLLTASSEEKCVVCYSHWEKVK